MAPILGAVGLGVSSMSRSVHFYTEVLPLGLKVTQTFDVAAFTETVLSLPPATSASGKKIPTGSQIILMEYKNSDKPVDQQGKWVFYVDDVADCMRRCKEYGCKVFLEPGGSQEEWARGIGMVRDPDGFLVEFIPAASSKSLAKM